MKSAALPVLVFCLFLLAPPPATADTCAACAGLDGFVPPDAIDADLYLMVGKARRSDKVRSVQIQEARGVVRTGLKPAFIEDGNCPGIDTEAWAIDYSAKRPWPALHKGVDIPRPRGTPIRAIADGMVIGIFENADNRKGIEIALRHRPEQTGLPFWTYSQYTHLTDMPTLAIGDAVRMGEVIGKTGNSGKMGRNIRRDALHFAVLFSAVPAWSNDGRVFVPADGFFMDPVAFYRQEGPYISAELARLPSSDKAVPVAYLKTDGTPVPAGARRIWPYPCK